MTKSITADMTISEILEIKPKAAQVLHKFGMHCLGCAIASGETLKEAAEVHDINLDELLSALNEENS